MQLCNKWKIIFLCGTLSALCAGVAVFFMWITTPKQVDYTVKGSSKWKMIWNDEFDYEGAVDSTLWSYDTGGHGWGNRERQNYTKELKNVYVKDGILTIKAIKHNDGVMDEYTSGRIHTAGKGDFVEEGRIEVRARLPRGKGIWSAIFLLPTEELYGGWPNSGEMDIMESVGHIPNLIHSTIHVQDYNHMTGTYKQGTFLAEDIHVYYYTYAVEWYSDRLDFYVNEKKIFTYEKESEGSNVWPFDIPFHLVLSVAVGGLWGGQEGIDGDIFPQAMEVDYVRYYSKSVD